MKIKQPNHTIHLDKLLKLKQKSIILFSIGIYPEEKSKT